MTPNQAYYWAERLPQIKKELETMYEQMERTGVFQEVHILSAEVAIQECEYLADFMPEAAGTITEWANIPDDKEVEE